MAELLAGAVLGAGALEYANAWTAQQALIANGEYIPPPPFYPYPPYYGPFFGPEWEIEAARRREHGGRPGGVHHH